MLSLRKDIRNKTSEATTKEMEASLLHDHYNGEVGEKSPRWEESCW